MEPEHDGAPSWHAAVERARFDPYEPDTDGYRWASSFAGNGAQIGVCGTVDQHTVRVETASRERTLPDELERRDLIRNLLSRHVVAADENVSLPYQLTVERKDRDITVGPESYVCQGIRVAGGTPWVGSLTIGDLRVRITTDSPVRNLAVRKCTDAPSLSRTPPRPE